MFKRILHPTDFSPVAIHAFEHAVSLAQRFGAEMRVIHAMVLHGYDPKLISDGLPLLEKAYEAVEKELSRGMEKIVHKAPVSVEKVFRKGFAPADVILEEAESYEPGLIVMGTHGHAPLRHFFLGSVAEKVVRYATCSVMTLGRREHDHGPYKNILLPLDFSDPNKEAAQLAVSVARADGAALHLLHVFEEVIPPSFYAAGDAFQWDPDLKERCKEAMDDLIGQLNAGGIEIRKHVREGHVPRNIAAVEKDEEIDLIVLGARGLSDIDRLPLGGVTEKVLRSATCPVLTGRASP